MGLAQPGADNPRDPKPGAAGDSPGPAPALPNRLEVARGAGLVIVRVVGTGNLLTAATLSDFAEAQGALGYRCFVVDLAECTGLDSTFMGCLVGLAHQVRQPTSASSLIFGGRWPAKAQEKEAEPLSPQEALCLLEAEFSRGRLPGPPGAPAPFSAAGFIIAINVSPECRELLGLLGVDRFISVLGRADLSRLETASLTGKEMNREERHQLILDTHLRLVQMDQRNEARFGEFLRMLSQELAKGK